MVKILLCKNTKNGRYFATLKDFILPFVLCPRTFENYHRVRCKTVEKLEISQSLRQSHPLSGREIEYISYVAPANLYNFKIEIKLGFSSFWRACSIPLQ